ncbi:MAG: AtpZ/AtpI family protein [Aequorivita sp.]|nr:AtpZ/AtpI family protein [Aequorivita sp.]
MLKIINLKTILLTEPNESKNQKPSSRLSGYARYSGIAFQMIAIIGLGSYGGMKLDEKWPNKYSLYTIICSLLSVAIATYFVIKQANSISKDK